MAEPAHRRSSRTCFHQESGDPEAAPELSASRAHSEGRDPGGKRPSPKDLQGIWPISRASPNRQSIIYRLGEALLAPGIRQGEKEAGRRAGYEGSSPSPEHAPSALCPAMPGWDSENHPSSLPAARGRRMGEAGCLSVCPSSAGSLRPSASSQCV